MRKDPEAVLEHFSAHDLRRTCETRLARLGFAQEVRDAVLGHTQSGLQRTYNKHDYQPEKRAALWSGPMWTTGAIDAAMHAMIRARAAAKFAPVDSAQLEAADAAIERVTSAGSAIVKRLGGVMAFRNAPVAKASRSLKALADG